MSYYLAEKAELGAAQVGELYDATFESGAPVLSLTAKTNTSIEFSWTDSETWDGYQVWRNGTLIDTTTLKTYEDAGLSPATEYSYEVRGHKTA